MTNRAPDSLFCPSLLLPPPAKLHYPPRGNHLYQFLCVLLECLYGTKSNTNIYFLSSLFFIPKRNTIFIFSSLPFCTDIMVQRSSHMGTYFLSFSVYCSYIMLCFIDFSFNQYVTEEQFILIIYRFLQLPTMS